MRKSQLEKATGYDNIQSEFSKILKWDPNEKFRVYLQKWVI